MKTPALLFAIIILTISANAQVGIGTNAPNSSAMLEVKSTNKGFLPPRVTLTGMADVSTVSSPATGLLIYNTATAGSGNTAVTPGYYFWNGSNWVGLAVQTVSNTYQLASTGIINTVNTGQDITTATGYTDVNNSTITVTVPPGYTNKQVMVRWDIWGDVGVSTAPGMGSLRFQVQQTGTSSQTIGSVMMTSWSISGAKGFRWNAPVSYAITGLSAGTYQFKLQLQREDETTTPSQIKIWGLTGLGQVYVQ